MRDTKLQIHNSIADSHTNYRGMEAYMESNLCLLHSLYCEIVGIVVFRTPMPKTIVLAFGDYLKESSGSERKSFSDSEKKLSRGDIPRIICMVFSIITHPCLYTGYFSMTPESFLIKGALRLSRFSFYAPIPAS